MDQQLINLAQILELTRRSGATWEPAPNPIATLSIEDMRPRLGFLESGGDDILSTEQREAIASELSRRESGSCSGRDWNQDGYITPVKDQGNVGSSVAFGTLAAVEGLSRIEHAIDLDLSEAHLLSWFAEVDPAADSDRKRVMNALNGLMTRGVVDESCFPCTEAEHQFVLCDDWESRRTRIKGWHQFHSTAEMKSWLCDRGPLVTALSVYEDFLWYGSGIYSSVGGNKLGWQCVCCVGFDDAHGYWVCKNSWGQDWGESGFFRIAYGQVGIDARMWAIDGIIVP